MQIVSALRLAATISRNLRFPLFISWKRYRSSLIMDGVSVFARSIGVACGDPESQIDTNGRRNGAIFQPSWMRERTIVAARWNGPTVAATESKRTEDKKNKRLVRSDRLTAVVCWRRRLEGDGTRALLQGSTRRRIIQRAQNKMEKPKYAEGLQVLCNQIRITHLRIGNDSSLFMFWVIIKYKYWQDEPSFRHSELTEILESFIFRESLSCSHQSAFTNCWFHRGEITHQLLRLCLNCHSPSAYLPPASRAPSGAAGTHCLFTATCTQLSFSQMSSSTMSIEWIKSTNKMDFGIADVGNKFCHTFRSLNRNISRQNQWTLMSAGERGDSPTAEDFWMNSVVSSRALRGDLSGNTWKYSKKRCGKCIFNKKRTFRM